MMDAIATLIQRLCACGLLCGVALSLVKHSGQEGILRLCCACLMVVVLFTSLPSLQLETPDWDKQSPLQRQADEAMEQSLEYQKAQICQGAEAYLEQQTEQMGITCTVTVLGEIGEDRVFSIRQVTIRSGALLGSQKEAIEQLCRQSLGIGAEQIVWKGEDGDAQDEVGHAGISAAQPG